MLNPSVICVLTLAVLMSGCNSEPASTPRPAMTPAPTTMATTQPTQIVAELSTLNVNKADLDSLLYESYGLRMLFDIVELDLAKTMLAKQGGQGGRGGQGGQGGALTPADVQRERQIILAKICGDAAPSSYEDLFNQFLDREHLSRAEFDLKIVQTDACLRKIVEPVIVGKLTDATVKKGFEQLYGAKREIADIEVANVRQATIARNRLKTQPFDRVAREMSIDTRTSANGGVWPPFSAQNALVPKVMLDSAFTLEKGQISDILQADSSYHIIKLLDIIEPRVVKYEDVKDDVRKQMEDQAVQATMKTLRDQLTSMAQQQLKITDPTLKAQWDALIAQQQSKPADRNSALQQMNDVRTHATTTPATQP